MIDLVPDVDQVTDVLLLLVEKGLLCVGYAATKGFIFWPTFRGMQELDMEPSDECHLPWG